MNARTLAVALLATSFAIPALADEDEAAIKQAKQELSLKEEAQGLKDACGKVPTTSIDWASFPKDFGNYSVSGYCASTVSALRTLCDGKAKKAVIKRSLKSVTCRYAEKGKRKLSSSGGKITVDLDFDAANYDEWARKELLRSF